MAQEPTEDIDVDSERIASDRDNEDQASASEGSEGEDDAPADLMVVSRARRSNAGNRMATLLATSAEEEEWGEEWEEAANEEEFVGDDANDQADFNMDSSSSEDEDEGDDDDAGEKELQKAERQERIKKRKPATNPFAARLAAAARKRVKLDVPSDSARSSLPPRPKKKSERASWIPTEEDGPIRTSSRRQTMANKAHTMAKLKAKDRRRDDTLAMMKAAEARKAKDEPKSMSQAERLAEAARVERVNSKSLHRWEEAEEQRAAERQAKIDALKNRQIEGPFVRYYSGPAIWVDDKLKYTGKNAPKIEDLDEKLNKDIPLTSESQEPQPSPSEQPKVPVLGDSEHKVGIPDQLPLNWPHPRPVPQSQTAQHGIPEQAKTTPNQAQLPPQVQPPATQLQEGHQQSQLPTAQPQPLPSQSPSQHQADVQASPQPAVVDPESQIQAEFKLQTQQPPQPDLPSEAVQQTSNPTTDVPSIGTNEKPPSPQANLAASSTAPAPSENSNTFLFGIEQYASEHKEPSKEPEPSPKPDLPMQTQALSQSPAQAADQAQVKQEQAPSQPSQGFEQPPSQSTHPSPSTPQIGQNPFAQPPSTTPTMSIPPNPFSAHPPLTDPALFNLPPNQTPESLLQQFQNPQPPPQEPQLPPPPPPPPRRKVIRLALRNLLTLTSFPTLDSLPSTAPSTRHHHQDKDKDKDPSAVTTTARSSRNPSALSKEQTRLALIHLSSTLFSWSIPEATAYVTAMMNAPKTKKEREAAAKGPKKEICPVTNEVARFRDPVTGIAYRDLKAYRVLKGVVGGGFVWSGGLGCYVGGRVVDPSDRSGGGGSGDGKMKGTEPVRGVPKRFIQMAMGSAYRPPPPPPPPPPAPAKEGEDAKMGGVEGGEGKSKDADGIKVEPVAASADGTRAAPAVATTS